jgi:hypothetical protein
MAFQPLIEAALESAQDRCEALQREVRKQKPTSAAASAILELVGSTANLISDKLRELARDEELQEVLKPEEFLVTIYRFSGFIPVLYHLLGFVEGSQRISTAGNMIPPLRRVLRRCLDNSDVIFTAQAQFNYSFSDLAGYIRRLYDDAGPDFAPIAARIPHHLIYITFPSVEATNVLLHSVIAHEIGHGIYTGSGLDNALFAEIHINQEKINQLTRQLVAAARGATAAAADAAVEADGEPEPGSERPASAAQPSADQRQLSEIEAREMITSAVNSAIEGWLKELACDAIGLTLFGPAYYFAFSQFIVSFQYVDTTGVSHPAPRLRLRLMRQMMENGDIESRLGFRAVFPAELEASYGRWDELTTAVRPANPFLAIAFDAIEPMLDRIAAGAIAAVDRDLRFSAERLSSAAELSKVLMHVIPPVDTLGTEGFRPTDLPAVLNAGWYVFHSAPMFESFARRSNLDAQHNRLDCKARLNDVLLKSLELIEIHTRWNEVSLAVEREGHS